MMSMAFVFKIIKLLRIFFLFISCLGYILFLSKKIKAEFTIGILFSSISCLIFLGGLLNILSFVAILIFIIGIALFFMEVYKYSKATVGKSESHLLNLPLSSGYCFFFFSAFYFIILLYGLKFVHYDNFSHWGLVARFISSTDRFPSFKDPLIAFQSYPLGSASFIYYLSKISGIYTEWFFMYAQSLLMIGLSLGLFAFVNKKYALFFSISVIILLCSNINFIDILVDTLLPVASIGGFSYCLWCHVNSKSENYYFLLAPYLVFLAAIKSSGLLFSLLLILFASPALFRLKAGRIKLLSTFVSPFFFSYGRNTSIWFFSMGNHRSILLI